MHDLLFYGDTDLAAVVVTTFVLFFVGLVIYLRREDRREGYPLEDDVSGRLEPSGGLFFAARPKTFLLSGGLAPVTKPNNARDIQVTNARRTSRAPGSPLEPTGNPLLAGVGPGSFAYRAHRPDRTLHGETKITPMRAAEGFSIDRASPDPRGMTVVGADGLAAGVVADLWIDRAEYLIRYLEVDVVADGNDQPLRRVLVPMTMACVEKGRRRVRVDAVLASQFAEAPVLVNPDQVTFLEEERICAYFGAGFLYATPSRSEPFL
jgi:photosynthetic reaction center H subunit